MLTLLAALTLLHASAGALAPSPTDRKLLSVEGSWQEPAEPRTAFYEAFDRGDAAAAEAAARRWIGAVTVGGAGAPTDRTLALAALAWSLCAAAEPDRDAARRALAEAAAAAETEHENVSAFELLFDAWLRFGEFAEAERLAVLLADRFGTTTSWEPAYPFAKLGSAHWEAERTIEADRCFRRALELLTPDCAPGFDADVRMEYSTIRRALGDHEGALALLDAASTSSLRDENPLTAVRVAMRRAGILADLGDFTSAAAWFGEALRDAEAAGNEWFVQRVRVIAADQAVRAHDFDAAAEWLEPIAGQDPSGWDAWTTKTVRTVESRLALRAGDAHRGLELAEAALSVIAPEHPREYWLLPWMARARAQLALGNYAEVTRALHAAALLLDSPEVHARGDARVFLRTRYADWLQLAADLGWATTQSAAPAERAAAIAAAWLEVDRWKARTLAEALDGQETMAPALGDDTLLLDYVGGESVLYAFRRHRGADALFALAPRVEVEAALRAYHECLADAAVSRSVAMIAVHGRGLHALLLEPCLAEGVRRVLWVPEADWPGVPLAALVSASPDGQPATAFAQLRFAVEDFAFVQAPSRAVGLRLRGRARAPADGAALVFADPQCADGRWSPLPGTRGEAVAVLAALGGGHLLLGDEATKSSLLDLIEHSPVIHLATHAIADPITPGRSRIACSGVGADSDLTLAELQARSLRANVVVLSACETAGGRALRGEGAQSLAGGFLRAGAGAVVATLWPVFDADASAMMKEFYAAGGARSVAPEEALRAAQLAMLRGAAPDAIAAARGRLDGGRPLLPEHALAAPLAGHPLRWAGFVYFGPFTEPP
jgi:tetratricopeptide (TPR) repeat protein